MLRALPALALLTACSATLSRDGRPAGDGDSTAALDGSAADALRDDVGPSSQDGPVSRDGQPAPDQLVIDPLLDSDGDGLPDGFEAAFPGFDPARPDSDGDGVADGDEDDDGDGLSAKLEWALWQATPAVAARKPSLLRKDLLLEIDAQQGFAPPSTTLGVLVEAFDAVALVNLDGTKGITVHVFLDETSLPVAPMAEPLADRLDYLGQHGPQQVQGAFASKMVHVIFASERPGAPNRGGEMVASSGAGPEKAGVLMYGGNLQKIFPICASAGSPAVTYAEALASTFVHEVGHTLQLGHDTAVGGGINPYNIMSTDLGDCTLLKQRTRGDGNGDPTLGATPGAAPRFSNAAAALIKLRNKISVEADQFEVGSGHEM